MKTKKEHKLINKLFENYCDLMNYGWKPIEYCPKDGSEFLAIEMGSTGIHKCVYDGKWPDGAWWIKDNNDCFPSNPILFKPLTS